MPVSCPKAARRARIYAKNACFRALFTLAPPVVINLPILDFAAYAGYNYTQFIYKVIYSYCRVAYALLMAIRGRNALPDTSPREVETEYHAGCQCCHPVRWKKLQNGV